MHTLFKGGIHTCVFLNAHKRPTEKILVVCAKVTVALEALAQFIFFHSQIIGEREHRRER
jgi:hypothetical protein